jgi:hypothetical protein
MENLRGELKNLITTDLLIPFSLREKVAEGRMRGQ